MSGRHIYADQGRMNGWKNQLQVRSGKLEVAKRRFISCNLQFATCTLAVWVLLFTSAYAQPKNYVTEWLILGSFSAQGKEALSADFVGGETLLQPRGGLKTAGQIWRHYQKPGLPPDAAYLNFLEPILDLWPVEQAVAYAHIYVHSPRADTLMLLTGSDDDVAIWVNGISVWQHALQREHRFDDDTVQVSLREGWNAVLFKVTNRVGAWTLSACFIGSETLKIQAEVPDRLVTIPRPDPELVRIRPLELTDDVIFTRDNVPTVGFQTVINNLQEKSLGDCRARLFAPGGASSLSRRPRSALDAINRRAQFARQVGREHDFPLRAGEIRSLNFRVPVSTIVSGFQSSGSWQMRLQFGDHEVRRVIPLRYDARLLGRILGTYEVEGIDTVAANGAIEFRRVLFMPKEWAGFPVILSADIGQAEGLLLINGKEVREHFSGDSGDLVLTESAEVGTRYEVQIILKQLGVAESEQREMPSLPRLFLTVEHDDLRRYLMTATLLQQYHGERLSQQEELEEKMWVAMKAGDAQTFNQLIAEAKSALPKLPEAAAKLPEVSLISNAHIDLARQWRYSEASTACRAVFAQAMRNMEKYPDFYFSHGQALSYWWIEQEDPELFDTVRQAIREGRWEIVGGTWVESDANIPSGEALARQFLYGKRYFKQKFGVDVEIAWMPDAFGHAWSLPQILKKSGILAYVFYRPWDTMRLLEWEGPDGSRVLAYRPPKWYNATLTKDASRFSDEAKKEFGWPKALQLFGSSDHGGGPSRREIRLAEDLAYQPMTPTVRMARADGFFKEINSRSPATKLSVHRDEINFVFPGAWTSQAWHKSNNRRSEMLLPAAETFSLLAQPFGMTYAQTDFTNQWRSVLYNQAHDLLSGWAKVEIYEEAQRLHREALETAKAALDKSMTTIETAINSQSKNKDDIPVAVYNTLNWARTDEVEVDITVPYQPQAQKSKSQKSKRKAKDLESDRPAIPTPYFRDAEGKRLLAQVIKQDSTAEGMRYRLLFLPEQVPAYGYKVYWLEWSNEEPKITDRARVEADSLTMSNGYYSIKIDPMSGGLLHLVDSQLNREWMATNFSGLEMLGEKGGEMSALNIDYDGSRERLQMSQPPKVLETGPLRARLLTRFAYGNSQIEQEYVIYATLPRLEVRYHVNWRERNKMLKVVFPFHIPDGRATYEIPFAAITRPANGQEVPMQKWMDVSNEQFGVMVANDSKYGAEVQDGLVRLTALRSPDAPDANADEGEHYFAYAIFPHTGDWRNAGAVQNGYAFNLPLMARVITQQPGKLPPVHSFVSVEPAAVIVSALKKAEDDDAWILRLYESTGLPTTATISLPFVAKKVNEVNLIEWEEKPLPFSGQKLTVNLGAWEVKTLKISQQ